MVTFIHTLKRKAPSKWFIIRCPSVHRLARIISTKTCKRFHFPWACIYLGVFKFWLENLLCCRRTKPWRRKPNPFQGLRWRTTSIAYLYTIDVLTKRYRNNHISFKFKSSFLVVSNVSVLNYNLFLCFFSIWIRAGVH